uniref:hypothetical protein n=1 Tax=Herbidospora sakaeratensis TaxID=564415 RepID=UPI0012FC4C7D|nr:hypothetical protein [Herbidospora sakaeratensis]
MVLRFEQQIAVGVRGVGLRERLVGHRVVGVEADRAPSVGDGLGDVAEEAEHPGGQGEVVGPQLRGDDQRPVDRLAGGAGFALENVDVRGGEDGGCFSIRASTVARA